MPRSVSFDRDALIAKARDVFWEKGYAGTSMKDLEHALGLHPGSFYAAFGSKDALYDLTLDTYVQDGRARLDELRSTLDPLNTLKAHLRSVAKSDATPARACMLSKTLLELQGQNSVLAKKAADHLAKMEAEFASLFRQAQELGDISPHASAEKLARRYQSDLTGLRVSAERGDVDAMELAEEIATDLDRLARLQ